MSYLYNDCDIMNCFGKFEKFLPHSITIPSFITVGSEWPELDRGYKLGSQDTPYKLGLSAFEIKSQIDRHISKLTHSYWQIFEGTETVNTRNAKFN